MNFSDIAGHERVKDFLLASYKEDRIAHAYIFHGQEGIGKRLAAQEFFKFLICRDNSGGDSCGRCKFCRKMDAGAAIDWIVVEKESRDSVIKVDRIREILKIVHFPPMEAKYRGILIDNAETISIEAVSALLKTLEEPPPSTYFFLISSKPEQIPDTIHSRCSKVYFQHLRKDEIYDLIRSKHQLNDADAMLAASLSGGSMGMAEALPGEKIFQERRDILLAFMGTEPSDHAQVLNFLNNLENQSSEIQQFLTLMRIFLRDLILARSGFDAKITNVDLAAEIRDFARKTSFQTIAGLYGVIEKADEFLSYHANRKLVSEWLAFSLFEQ